MQRNKLNSVEDRGPSLVRSLHACYPSQANAEHGPTVTMSHANRRIGFLERFAAWRRPVAVLCVLVFGLFNAAHAAGHYEGIGTAIDAQFGDSPDEPADGSKSAGLALGHCCGCATAALPVFAATNFVGLVEVGFSLPPGKCIRAHDPTFATPPPKF